MSNEPKGTLGNGIRPLFKILRHQGNLMYLKFTLFLFTALEIIKFLTKSSYKRNNVFK